MEQSTNIIIGLFILALWVVSFFIPFYGFIQKRWKGLGCGCLTQVAFCILVMVTLGVGRTCYVRSEMRSYRDNAMVTVRKANAGGKVHVWYLNSNEECFYECKDNQSADADSTDVDKIQLFDVIPLYSAGVCVDDKVFVRFDLKKRFVTAAEYDEPIEVVNVDWDKVNDYFNNHP